MTEQTPRQIVDELDKYIVGQDEAKRSVAIALRNRWRSRQLEKAMRDEVIPKNILMIGSTGVGKTEIARRLARLVEAPFIKVEATKFTEVGYVGRDVESMIRELAEVSVRMVKKRELATVQDKAAEAAEERLVDAFVPQQAPVVSKAQTAFASFFGGSDDSDDDDAAEEQPPVDDPKYKRARAYYRKQLKAGKLEDRVIEIEVDEGEKHIVGMGTSFEMMNDNIQEMVGAIMPKKKRVRKLKVSEARKILTQDEAQKLIDMDEITETAIHEAEHSGIIFLDELDKVAVKDGKGGGPDVSREGVQRDILPIVEGSTVMTKYGPVKTDFILFIAAGAFHMAKPSDLIPELQGRFPIRVELTSLKVEDFKRILTEPRHALVKQYEALLATEGVTLAFDESAIDELAQMAYDVNSHTENIGARRLHTLLEKLLEDVSFDAPDMADGTAVNIDAAYVRDKLHDIARNRDLSQFVL